MTLKKSEERKFQSPKDSLAFNPEYIALQREEVIKKHSDKVLHLQGLIKGLEEKKGNIDLELENLYGSRKKKLDEFEVSLKKEKKDFKEERSEFKKEVKDFNTKKDAINASIEIKKSELEKLIAKNESLKLSVLKNQDILNGERTALDLKQSEFKDKSEGLDAFKKALDKRKSDLDFEENNVMLQKSDLKSKQDALEEIKKDYLQKLSDLDAKKTENENKAKELKEKELSLIEKAKKLDEALIEAQQEKEVAQELLKSLNLDKEDIASRENILKIKETNFKQESAIKKRELDERESNVRALEKRQVG